MGNEENGNEDWHLPNEYWMLGSGKRAGKGPRARWQAPGLASLAGMALAWH